MERYQIQQLDLANLRSNLKNYTRSIYKLTKWNKRIDESTSRTKLATIEMKKFMEFDFFINSLHTELDLNTIREVTLNIVVHIS